MMFTITKNVLLITTLTSCVKSSHFARWRNIKCKSCKGSKTSIYDGKRQSCKVCEGKGYILEAYGGHSTRAKQVIEIMKKRHTIEVPVDKTSHVYDVIKSKDMKFTCCNKNIRCNIKVRDILYYHHNPKRAIHQGEFQTLIIARYEDASFTTTLQKTSKDFGRRTKQQPGLSSSGCIVCNACKVKKGLMVFTKTKKANTSNRGGIIKNRNPRKTQNAVKTSQSSSSEIGKIKDRFYVCRRCDKWSANVDDGYCKNCYQCKTTLYFEDIGTKRGTTRTTTNASRTSARRTRRSPTRNVVKRKPQPKKNKFRCDKCDNIKNDSVKHKLQTKSSCVLQAYCRKCFHADSGKYRKCNSCQVWKLKRSGFGRGPQCKECLAQPL